MRTHYDNLQVSRSASPEVIRAAYKALAQKLHPDKNSSPLAAQQFSCVTEAYEKLSDPDFRSGYDDFLSANGSSATSDDSETIALLLIDAWVKGRLAAECDEPISSNPFDAGSKFSDLWDSAYKTCPKILKIFNKAKNFCVVWAIQVLIWAVAGAILISLKIWLTRLLH